MTQNYFHKSIIKIHKTRRIKGRRISIIFLSYSFVLDDVNNVIDFTANVIMPKKQYYLLQEVNELNCINYKEYMEEKDKSIEFDESNTLYNLLRNAVYKQYLLENNKN